MSQAMRLRQLAGALVVILVGSTSGAAQTQLQTQAVYTPVGKCALASRLTVGDRVFDKARGAVVQRCPGAGGWTVFVIDDDPRSWLALQRGEQLHPLDREMIDTFNLGQFPNVAGSRVLEWRVSPGGQALALIVRVSYQPIDGAGGRSASTLLVFDLRGAAPRLLGMRQNNADARALAAEAAR